MSGATLTIKNPMNKLTTSLLVLITVFVGMLALQRQEVKVSDPIREVVKIPVLSGSGFDSYSGTTVVTKTVSSTVVQVLGADANRRVLIIQNHSAIPLYCLLDGSLTAASSSVTSSLAATPVGIRILATSTSQNEGLFIEKGYTGVVNCVASGFTTSTVITSP